MSIYLFDARHRWFPNHKLKPVETQRRKLVFLQEDLTLPVGTGSVKEFPEVSLLAGRLC